MTLFGSQFICLQYLIFWRGEAAKYALNRSKTFDLSPPKLLKIRWLEKHEISISKPKAYDRLSWSAEKRKVPPIQNLPATRVAASTKRQLSNRCFPQFVENLWESFFNFSDDSPGSSTPGGRHAELG
jgi:hypothetical protein